MSGDIILSLALIIFLAKILGELAQRIKMPALLGEILAGIILGPSLFHLIEVNDVFMTFAEMGIILLIFLAGFEHGSIKELLKYKNTSILISILSSTLPVLAVVILTQIQGFSLVTSLFLAVALGATSMGVSLRSLIGVDEVGTKVGKTVIGSLVLNDITGLFLLTIVVTFAEISTGGSANILLEIGKVLLSVFICFIIFFISLKFVPKLTHMFIKFKTEEAQFSFALIIILLSAWAAANFGLSTIIGAFIAGIMLSKSPIFETHSFQQKVSSLSYGFFIPVFFVMTGAQINFNNFGASFSRAVLFFGLIATVQVGCAFVAALINKYTIREGLLVGTAMLPYGEVTLVVMSALIALSTARPEYFLGEDISGVFSSILMLILITVIFTPLFMRLINLLKGKENGTT